MSHPFDDISGVALRAWERAAPESYAECVAKIDALIEEYGELGVMAMIRAIDSTADESPMEGVER